MQRKILINPKKWVGCRFKKTIDHGNKVKMQLASCCYMHAKSSYQHTMPLLLSIIQKFNRYYKDTKEKTTCKLVVAQASTFCTILNFVVLPILNSCSKRKVLQSEELLAEHVNDKLQMHG
jgi:hypothetical protein